MRAQIAVAPEAASRDSSMPMLAGGMKLIAPLILLEPMYSTMCEVRPT